jgi:hypothetical protein
VPLNVPIPTLVTGAYWIGVSLDADEFVVETDETNNTGEPNRDDAPAP